MVVNDLDLVGMTVLPFETDSILLIYTNAVLFSPFTPQAFKMITWRDRKLSDFADPIYLVQFPLCNCP